jgi:hypothetical protein
MYFLCENLKNTSYKSCGPCNDAYLHQKLNHDSKVCCGTCTNHSHLARKPRELLLGSNFLWRVFLWILGMPCLVFFLGTTSHTMTLCAVFTRLLLQWVGDANVDRPNIALGSPNWAFGGRLGTASSLVTLKFSTFKLKLRNTSMILFKAFVIDYDIFVMIICKTKKWNDYM